MIEEFGVKNESKMKNSTKVKNEENKEMIECRNVVSCTVDWSTILAKTIQKERDNVLSDTVIKEMCEDGKNAQKISPPTAVLPKLESNRPRRVWRWIWAMCLSVLTRRRCWWLSSWLKQLHLVPMGMLSASQKQNQSCSASAFLHCRMTLKWRSWAWHAVQLRWCNLHLTRNLEEEFKELTT